ncbi:hypothetical protein, partial [Enterococcus faecium]|uniref:hypothetical protein n=1 Tax=Enterococcus faecium TaxID=1352 RepID=UPI003F423CE9
SKLTVALVVVLTANVMPNCRMQAQAPKKLKVALYLDAGARPRKEFIQKLIDQRDFKVTTVTIADIKAGCLGDSDALIVPGYSVKNEM